jgi:hypothetical protein
MSNVARVVRLPTRRVLKRSRSALSVSSQYFRPITTLPCIGDLQLYRPRITERNGPFISSPRYHGCMFHSGLVRDYKEWHYSGFMEGASLQNKEAWLASMLSESPERADAQAFLIVLRALVNSGLPDAAIRAERWVLRLERHAEDMQAEDPSLSSIPLPTPECYQCVIEAWGRADNEDPGIAITRAERWLLKHANSSNPSLRPNTAGFNAFLNGVSRGRGHKNAHSSNLVRTHAQKAESTLRYMIAHAKEHGKESTAAPTTDSFNYVIRAWTRCRRSGDVADRAMDALHLLENYQLTVDANVGPDQKSLVMIMDAIAVRAKLKVKLYLYKKGTRWSPDENGLNEIKILNDIIKYLREKGAAGERQMLPTTIAYNTLMSTWAHLSRIHPNGPLEAEKVLQHMISLKDRGSDEVAPDALSYLIVMRCWMNSDQPNRGHRVEWWLSKQWKDYEFEGRDKLIPTTDTYNVGIQTYERMTEPQKAQRLLSDLIRRSDLDQTGKLKPNSESFASVIRAWLIVAGMGSKDALETAVRWLDSLAEMEKHETGIVSMVDLYTGVLRAARTCASKYPEVLDLAVETLDKLRASRHTVNDLHYSRLLQIGLLAMSRSEHNDVRTAFITQIVEDCSEDGLISTPLLRALANGPVYYDGWTIEGSDRLTEKLFPDWPLPHGWTRNVKQDGHIPRRTDLMRTGFDLVRHGDDPYKNTFYKADK